MKYILQKKERPRRGRSRNRTKTRPAVSQAGFFQSFLYRLFTVVYFTFFITSATFSFMASSRKSRATMVPSGANKMMWGIP